MRKMTMKNEIHFWSSRSVRFEDKCKELEAEIAKLKGDQVPFAYAYHRDTGVWWLSTEKPKLPGYTEIRELFTHPQKPVVLPEAYDDGHGNEWLPRGATIAAIEAAGGIIIVEPTAD